MSIQKKKPLKRDQALNDATSGQFGEQPSAISPSHSEVKVSKNARRKVARKMSRHIS